MFASLFRSRARRAGTGTLRRTLGSLLVGAVVTSSLTPAVAAAAEVGVGPVDPSTRFPLWVSAGGTRLDLCLDAPECLGTRADLVGPAGEAFWYNASASVAGSGAAGLVEMATEAAFAGAGADQEIAFNRLRIRLDVPVAGTYRVDYPYGSKTYDVGTVSDGKEINDTQDVGCATPPCGDFADLQDSGDGGVGLSYLRWDPASGPAAPAGYLGDGLTAHPVVGSPLDRNYVEVTRVKDEEGNALTTPEVVAHEAQFTVQGRLAHPTVVADPAGGSFPGPVSVALVGSEPGAEVWYTDNGDAPLADDGTLTPSAKPYVAPLDLATDTRVRAVNVVDGAVVTDPVTGGPSAASDDTYVIDTGAPTLKVTPAGGTYGSAQMVTLTATDAKDASPKIYYRTKVDRPGSGGLPDPTSADRLYTGPIPVNGNADGAPTIIKAVAIDAAGNTSVVRRSSYLIQAPSVSASPAGGSYVEAQHVRLAASDPDAEIYYTTDGRDPVVTQDPDTMAVTGVEHGTPYTNDAVELTGYSTLKLVAVSKAGRSTVMSEDYLIDIPENRGKGALGSVSPVDHTSGYPFWYGERTDRGDGGDPVRLELCLDDPLCPVVGDLPDPTKPLSYPDNFPDESFFWSGEASMATGSGASALLVLAQEAAFGGAGSVSPGQQITFARLRIRLDDATPGETYTVTTPYGVDTVTADNRGRARMTEDIGCLAAPCDFSQALDGRVGPFLRWDPNVGPAAPAGYVGNPLVEHRVVGSPHGTNFFRVEGPGIGGDGVDVAETDLFTVQGRLAQLRATASPEGGLFSAPQHVHIRSSFPAESSIVYTMDGSDPSVDAAGVVTNGTEVVPADGTASAATVRIPPGSTTLKYMAVDLTSHATSRIHSEKYDIDATLPTVSASPDAATGPFSGGQLVTLSADPHTDEPTDGLSIYYTTDGTAPRLVDGAPAGATVKYASPLRVSRPTTVKALAVTMDGLVGPVDSFTFDIHNLKAVGEVDPSNGFPAWFQDFGTGPDLPSVRLDLCLDDPLCPVVGDRPQPDQSLSFPGNYPDEAFWWAGNAEFTDGVTRARLTLATEAAFTNGAVKRGDQIAFGRIRVKADNLVPGATYRVTHPYGVDLVTARDDGLVFATDDSGCLAGPCDWTQVLRAPVGPFLRWDEGAPAGYVGDGATPHTVVGSPFDTNVFRMEQVTDGTGVALAEPVLLGQTDQFVVQGRLAGLKATASPVGGVYTTAQSVQLSSNDSTAEVFYTTDGSDPSSSSSRYTGPIAVTGEGRTTVKFLAVRPDGSTSPIGTEVYQIDSVAPSLTASLAGGSFAGPQSVSLETDDPTASIFYTTDGSTPSLDSTPYTGPITIPRNLTLKARAVDPAGNNSGVRSWTFAIALPGSSLTLLTPAPATVSFGRATRFDGRLTANGAAVPGRVAVLQVRRLGTTGWVDAGRSVSTLSDGSYTIAGFAPVATADYRMAFPGDGQFQSTVSPVQRVSVRSVVTLGPLGGRVSRGRPVTYAGTVSPAHAGARVTVTVSAPGQRTLTSTATVNAAGRWTVTAKAPGRVGSYAVSARWGGDADHLGDTSGQRTLRVVR